MVACLSRLKNFSNLLSNILHFSSDVPAILSNYLRMARLNYDELFDWSNFGSKNRSKEYYCYIANDFILYLLYFSFFDYVIDFFDSFNLYLVNFYNFIFYINIFD